MKSEYQSFLICFHEGHTDIFHNGLPLGVIIAGQFLPHEVKLPKGAKQTVEIPPGLVDKVKQALELLPQCQPQT